MNFEAGFVAGNTFSFQPQNPDLWLNPQLKPALHLQSSYPESFNFAETAFDWLATPTQIVGTDGYAYEVASDLSESARHYVNDPTLPNDMRELLLQGGYKVVIREEDGERFVFPVTRGEKLDATVARFSSREVSSIEDWQGVRIPEAYKSGFMEWVPTDGFLLHMKRPFLGDGSENYVGRFSYNPMTHEFLPSAINISHNDSITPHGSSPFNSYMRGIYVRDRKVLLLKAYFNPLDDEGNFDPYKGYDSELDKEMVQKTLEMLARNGMPRDITIIVHANNQDVGKYTAHK